MLFYSILLFVLIGLGLGVLIPSNFFQIRQAAKRLHLRDKGEVQKTIHSGGTVTGLAHLFCRTPNRIGITEDGEAVHYCWRCEEILIYNTLADLKPQKEFQSEEALTKNKNNSVVLDFKRRH